MLWTLEVEVLDLPTNNSFGMWTLKQLKYLEYVI
jgi:hypothetical protein